MSQAAAGSASTIFDAGAAADRKVTDRTSGAASEPTSEAGTGSETLSSKQGGSDLLRQIEQLRDAQRALKEQKKYVRRT